jgi:hypothetical protein
MKAKLIGIFICTLLITTIIPVTGQITKNIINKHTDEVISPLSNDDKWMKTYDFNILDGASSVLQTPDGGYMILGATVQSFFDFDIWLIKTDSQGNIIWDKIIGGEDRDIPSMFKQTNDGGYIITGSTTSYGVGGDWDVWLIKTDENGTELWNKTFGDIHPQYGWDIEQTNDGGYIIAGSRAPGDAWCIKTDEFGNMVWNSTFGGPGSDSPNSVVQTLDGGYVFAGVFNYHEGINRDVWLFKTNSEGELLWEKTFVEDAPAQGWSMQLTDDGGYIITGEKTSLENFLNDILLIKTDDEGELLWEKTFGGDHEDKGLDVLQTNDGGYIIIGFTGWERFVGSDGLLIKTDSDGEEEWSKIYGRKNYLDLIGRGQQTMDGGYIIVGYIYKNLFWRIFGEYSDIWLIKTDSNGNAPPLNKNIRYKVTMPRNRAIMNTPFLYFLQQHLLMFPILRLLFQR